MTQPHHFTWTECEDSDPVSLQQSRIRGGYAKHRQEPDPWWLHCDYHEFVRYLTQLEAKRRDKE